MNKWWYFYNEKGEVNLIYFIEPSQEMLEQSNYIVADATLYKEGYTANFTVDLATKELKTEYVKKEETTEEKLRRIEAKNKELSNTVDQLLLINLN